MQTRDAGPMPIDVPSVDAAAAFLLQRYGPGTTDVAVLGGGDWSRAFSFRLGARDLVARFGLHVEDFRTDEKAMAFARPELPIPEILEIREALDGYYAISERSFGRFLDQLDEPGWRRVTPALLTMFDALRETELPHDGVNWTSADAEPLGWRKWLIESLKDRGGRTGGWRTALDQATESAEVYAAGEKEIRQLADACPESRHLLHRDLINRNVLVSEDASRIEAVFDWGCSMAGDFLYEVAWLTFWAPWDPPMEAIDFGGTFRRHYDDIGLDVPDFDTRLRCYELQIGLEHIAYTTFVDKPSRRDEITRRTAQLLESPLP